MTIRKLGYHENFFITVKRKRTHSRQCFVHPWFSSVGNCLVVEGLRGSEEDGSDVTGKGFRSG